MNWIVNNNTWLFSHWKCLFPSSPPTYTYTPALVERSMTVEWEEAGRGQKLIVAHGWLQVMGEMYLYTFSFPFLAHLEMNSSSTIPELSPCSLWWLKVPHRYPVLKLPLWATQPIGWDEWRSSPWAFSFWLTFTAMFIQLHLLSAPTSKHSIGDSQSYQINTIPYCFPLLLPNSF